MNFIFIVQLFFIFLLLILYIYFLLIVFAIERAKRTSKMKLPHIWSFILIFTAFFIPLSMVVILLVQ